MVATNPCVLHKVTHRGNCVFCDKGNLQLTDEHVVPLAINGRLILISSTCEKCRVVTGKLEGKLLRGPLWPIRRRFGVESRRPNEQPDEFSAVLVKANGARLPITISPKHWPEIWFDFFPAQILEDKKTSTVPFSKQLSFMHLGELDHCKFLGKKHFLVKSDKIEYPLNFEAADLMRLLAKIALTYIHCVEVDKQIDLGPIREIALGNTEIGMTYIGSNTSNLLGPRLPGYGIHRIFDYRRGSFRIVAIQLFVPLNFEPSPIYEVIFCSN